METRDMRARTQAYPPPKATIIHSKSKIGLPDGIRKLPEMQMMRKTMAATVRVHIQMKNIHSVATQMVLKKAPKVTMRMHGEEGSPSTVITSHSGSVFVFAVR